MRRKWLGFVGLVALLLGMSAGPEREVPAVVQDTSVKLFWPGGGSCSGVVVYQDDERAFVMTAGHCADKDDIVGIRSERWTTVGRRVYADLAGDVGAYETDPVWPAVATFAPPGDYDGAELVLRSYPYGNLATEWGHVRFTRGPPVLVSGHRKPYLYATTSSAPGSSGGGIFVRREDGWYLLSVVQIGWGWWNPETGRWEAVPHRTGAATYSEMAQAVATLKLLVGIEVVDDETK